MSYPWLLPSVRVGLTDNVLSLELHNKGVSLSDAGDAAFAIIKGLNGETHIRSFADNRFALHLIAELARQGWIATLSRPISAITAGREHLTRQLSYYAHIQQDRPDRTLDELASKTVTIVGVGGVGSAVASALAGAGVKRFVLIDPDTVDGTNLNRQFLFTTQDLGRSKVNAAQDMLLSRFPDLEIEALTIDYDREPPDASLAPCDLVVLCGECRAVINRPQLVGRTALLHGGYSGCIATAGPVFAPDLGGACMACSAYQTDARYDGVSGQRCPPLTHRWNPSGSTVNGLVGNLLAELATRYMAPTLGYRWANQQFSVDMSSLTFKVTELARKCSPTYDRCRYREVAAKSAAATHEQAESEA